MDPLEEYPKITKFQITKNLLVISVTFLIWFSAVEGFISLQSTLNAGPGMVGLALHHASGVISVLLLPKYLIHKFGSKMVMGLSMIIFLPYLVSNIYPHLSVIAPSSILSGVGISLLWSSIGAYLRDLSFLLFKLRVKSEDASSEAKIDESIDWRLKMEDILSFRDTVRKHKDSVFIIRQSALNENSLNENEMNKKNEKFIQVENNDSGKGYKEGVNACKDSGCKQKGILNGLNTNCLLNVNNLNNLIKNNYSNLSETEKNEKNLDEEFPASKSTFERDPVSQQSKNNERNLLSCGVASSFFLSIASPSTTNSKALKLNTARVLGVFSLVYLSCHIWSNVISYFVLYSHKEDMISVRNSTCSCGCDDKSGCLESNLHVPNTETRRVLTILFIVMCLVSSFLVFKCLDVIQKKDPDAPLPLNLLSATYKFQMNQNQVLLLPLSVFLGLMQAFIIGDYSRDFVGCSLGITQVPLVLMVGGCCLFASCYSFGWLQKHFGRSLICLAMATLNVTVNVIMLSWRPDPESPGMIFVVAGMLGVIYGITWCLLKAFYSILFTEEEEIAFTSLQVWHEIASAVASAYSNYICTDIKIYVLLTVFTIGIFGYFTAERIHTNHKTH